MVSHIFVENNKENKFKNIENQNKINNYRDDYYHLGDEIKERNLTNNDRSLWGSVHSKWTKIKINWDNPQTEIMFGNTFTQEMNENYGKKGPSPFQRMINQMADSRNADTITGIKKELVIKDIKKPPSMEKINDYGYKKIENMINDIPNLKENKKNKIKNNATTAILNGENNWNKNIKDLKKHYSNNKINKKENKENNISEYVLNYPIKGQFEKYEENDIKLMFGNKGLYI